MARMGGLDYELIPQAERGGRIGEMRLDNGDLIRDSRTYKVAGWSSTGEVSPGPPVWEIVADYTAGQGTLRLDK